MILFFVQLPNITFRRIHCKQDTIEKCNFVAQFDIVCLAVWRYFETLRDEKAYFQRPIFRSAFNN